MKPLGYVEKGNGQVEAVVSEGDQVYVVHEGEVFAEKYKVTKISQFAVEVVDANADRSSVQPPEVKTLAAQRAPANPPHPPPTGPHAKLDEAVGRQPVNLEVVAKREPTSDSQRLGYVEAANGQIQSVVADGEYVRLVPGASAVVAISNPPAGLASPVEVASVHAGQAPPTGRPETTPVGRTEKVAQPSLPPGSIFQLVTHRSDDLPPGSMAGQDATMAESFQPGALAAPHYVGSAEEKIANPVAMEAAAKRPDTRPSTTKSLATLGYVEWASGQVEGIVAEDDEVFLVKEGDVFAEKYRALKVSPDSMVVAEEARPNGTPPPAETVTELDLQLTAGLGASAGLGPPGDGSPVVPFARDEQVSAPAPGPESRPPNKAGRSASRLSHTPRAQHNLLASPKARAPAADRTEPASVPITLTSLGYIEKANGEVQAIVVQDDQVYLVRQGDFFAYRFKALSVTASAVVAIEVSPPEAASQISPDASTKVQLSSAKLFDMARRTPSEAVQTVTLLPQVESTGKALMGSGTGLLEFQQGVGFHFRFSMAAAPSLPH